MNEGLILAGQLLGTAFACGLNLYATVALLGLAARFELVAELPVGMGGLENGVVIATATALYLVELMIDRVPVLDHAWEAAHTLVRPAAAGLLVVLALYDLPLYLQVGAAAGAALTALAAHGTKSGLRLIVSSRWVDETGRLRPHRGGARSVLGLIEDVAAIALVIAALLYPVLAVFVLAAVLLILLLAGPRLWRAAFLGLRAVLARTRGFFGKPGWRSREQLPRALRGAVPATPLGTRPPRALAAAVTGLPRAGAYRHGFLVFSTDGARFVYRSLFRSRSAELRNISAVTVRRGILTDTMDVAIPDIRSNGKGQHRSRTITFFLLKDGPPAHLAAAELNIGNP